MIHYDYYRKFCSVVLPVDRPGLAKKAPMTGSKCKDEMP